MYQNTIMPEMKRKINNHPLSKEEYAKHDHAQEGNMQNTIMIKMNIYLQIPSQPW